MLFFFGTTKMVGGYSSVEGIVTLLYIQYIIVHRLFQVMFSLKNIEKSTNK